MKKIITILAMCSLAMGLLAAPDKEKFNKPTKKDVEGWSIAVGPDL